MSCFGSRMRSTWERLVLSNAAMRALEIFFFFMALASCQATTSLIACASSKMFSFFRKSSTLDPRCFLLIAPTPSAACAPALNRLHARGSRFLDKAVQGHEVVLVKANQYARRAISWQVCSHFPQTFSHRTAKRHAHRPTPLGPQQISPDRMALCLLQSFQPVARLATSTRTEEDQRDFLRCLLFGHGGLQCTI